MGDVISLRYRMYPEEWERAVERAAAIKALAEQRDRDRRLADDIRRTQELRRRALNPEPVQGRLF